MPPMGFRDDFKRNLLTGLAALFPILITIFLLSWLYRQLDVTVGKRANAVSRKVLVWKPTLFRVVFYGASEQDARDLDSRRAYAREHFPRFVGVFVGLLAAVVFVYLIGRFLRGYIGRRLMRFVDRFFERFPVIKAIYPHARQVGDLVFGQSGRRRFSRVVAVEYPRRGIYSVGFLTGGGLKGIEEHVGRPVVTVFVPTSPTPLTGFVVVVAPDEVLELDMTVDEAFRYFITAGLLTSEKEQPEGLPAEETDAREGNGPP